jgi:hypothetical protein
VDGLSFEALHLLTGRPSGSLSSLRYHSLGPLRAGAAASPELRPNRRRAALPTEGYTRTRHLARASLRRQHHNRDLLQAGDQEAAEE